MKNTIFEQNGTTLTVKPLGELNSVTSPMFEAELRQRLQGVSSVIVDLEKLDYISSAGLRVFLATEQYLDDHDAEMKVIHANEHVMDVFDMVGFTDVITVE